MFDGKIINASCIKYIYKHEGVQNGHWVNGIILILNEGATTSIKWVFSKESDRDEKFKELIEKLGAN